MQLYHRIQATVSVVWKAEVVHYSGSAIALHIWRLQLVHRAVSVIELRSVIGSVRYDRESTVASYWFVRQVLSLAYYKFKFIAAQS